MLRSLMPSRTGNPTADLDDTTFSSRIRIAAMAYSLFESACLDQTESQRQGQINTKLHEVHRVAHEYTENDAMIDFDDNGPARKYY